MEGSDVEGEQLRDALKRFGVKSDQFIDVMRRTGGNSAAITANVNAGGVGVWIATTCCLMMFAMNVVLTAVLVMHSRKIDALDDYISAIYMMAPHLKPDSTTEAR